MPEPVPVFIIPRPASAELDLAEKTADFSGTVDAASVLVCPANKFRTTLVFVNASGVVMYLSLGRPAAVARGIYLGTPGEAKTITCVELNPRICKTSVGLKSI
ncbi:unnamed protein product, partial [marine sediment metagenome]